MAKGVPNLPVTLAMAAVYSRKKLRAAERRTSTTTAEPPVPCGAVLDSPRPVQQRLPEPKAKRRKLVQMHLDLGQRDISQRSCRECGMVYAPGAADDIAVHKEYHRSFVRVAASLAFPGWRNERVVAHALGGKVVAVRQGDLCAYRRKAAIVDAYVARALGGSACDEPGFGVPCEEDMEWLALLFVSESRKSVEGYAFVERVSSARLAFVDRDGVASVNSETGMGVESASFCGLRKIWVAPHSRHRGVASVLLDAARANLVYGFIFPRDRMAFTATTQAGAGLALQHVYGDNISFANNSNYKSRKRRQESGHILVYNTRRLIN